MLDVNYSDDFSVKSLGEQEKFVYDIEVENDHNFLEMIYVFIIHCTFDLMSW